MEKQAVGCAFIDNRRTNCIITMLYVNIDLCMYFGLENLIKLHIEGSWHKKLNGRLSLISVPQATKTLENKKIIFTL